ncbi:MAG: hypothetical protein ACJ79K_06685 [Gemmatimonadaceae bacterium]
MNVTSAADAHGGSADRAWSRQGGIATASRASEWLEATVRRFDEYLGAEGLHRALGYLNSRTRFRFTGAYRFAPPLLCSIEIFDRDNPALTLVAAVPMETTYCSIVGADEAALVVDDAAQDDRVRTHPARAQYAAYCGVPLRDASGIAFGTLCHFDPRPRIGSAEQLALLQRVAPVVAAYALSR